MQTFSLRKSIINFYLYFFFTSLISFSLGMAFIIYGVQLIYNNEIERSIDYLLLPFGCFFLFIGIKNAIFYISNIITLKIENNSLYYKNSIIDKNNIQDINFRVSTIIQGGYPTIATFIKLKNGEEIKIFELFYSNNHIFQQYIYDMLINNKNYFQPIIIKDHSNKTIENKSTVYKGNLIFSWRGLYVIWIPIIFTFILILNSSLIETPQWVYLYFGIAIIIYFSVQLFFLFTIKTNNNDLILTHYVLPYKKIFKYNDIIQVHFLYRYKLPNQIKITTKDFKSYSFFAGTLRENSDWILLRDEIESKHVEVINLGVI